MLLFATNQAPQASTSLQELGSAPNAFENGKQKVLTKANVMDIRPAKINSE
jgi:hypothetical protein